MRIKTVTTPASKAVKHTRNQAYAFAITRGINMKPLGSTLSLDGLYAAVVSTKTGDWILGDEDGVVVIPSQIAEETIRMARDKVSGENTVRSELAQGMPITQAFAKYGIL